MFWIILFVLLFQAALGLLYLQAMGMAFAISSFLKLWRKNKKFRWLSIGTTLIIGGVFAYDYWAFKDTRYWYCDWKAYEKVSPIGDFSDYDQVFAQYDFHVSFGECLKSYGDYYPHKWEYRGPYHKDYVPFVWR